MYHVCTISAVIFFLSSFSPVCMLNIYRIIPIITVSYLYLDLQHFFCTSWTVLLLLLLLSYFLVLKPIRFIKLLSQQQQYFPCLWCCPVVTMRNVNPFCIQKNMVIIAGKMKNASHLKNGSLLVKVHIEKQAELLLKTDILIVPCACWGTHIP